METGRYPPIPLHESLRKHAREAPDKISYIWYGRAISFGELDRMTDAFAARLQALGVRKGEPVTLFMNNCPQYIIAQYGIQKIGAVCCPTSSLNKEHELLAQLDDLKPRVIVAEQSLLPLVRQVLDRTTLEHIFVTRYTDLLPDTPSLEIPDELRDKAKAEISLAGTEDFLAAASTADKPSPVPLDMDDTALMIYTSGSTGRSKGAMLSYRNAWYKSAAAAQCNGATADDVFVAIAPLYHIAGMVMGVNAPVVTGSTTVLLYRFDARTVAQAIERYRVSWMFSIATMNTAIMQLPDIGQFDLSSLKVNPVTSFGIDWTQALADQWRSVTSRCESFEASYGLSETHTVDTYMPRDAIRWGTHGKPVPGNEIRILDPQTGAPLPTGQAGEIVLRSAGTFKGYWNRPDATSETLRDGWVHTGDMGRLDEEGYLTFMGRFKEMIKVSGYSVFPEDVESILVKHPAIQQSAVIGVPDPNKGEVVRAFIVLRAGSSLEIADLIAWARENMAPYKVPREVRFMEALPATGAGKVLRRLLKDIP
jgi:long-chain acyl-CoA synthetase